MNKTMDLNPHSYQEWINKNLHQYQSSSLFPLQIKPQKIDHKYIPMPPPNITGKLHMGHALFLTIQDSLNRFWKNQGHQSLWLPGLDHAGLATHDKIIKYQKKHKLTYTQAAQELPKLNKETILNQIKMMGALPDWTQLTYTLDLDYQEFTLKILKLLWEDGRISYSDGQYYLDLKDLALELLEDLNKREIIITPSHELKNLTPFLNNLEKWNISRQIPWGTKLPFQITDGEIQYNLNSNSLDSLDTWLNSSLWPIASLMKNPDLIKDFYPAQLIETGADILFFWCARMLMMGNYIYKNQYRLNLTINHKYPFYNIYLHGIIRDKNGEKFSKSLGNGIDPLDMIAKYGADATRMFLITRTGPGEDIIFNEDELITYKKFMNKIWQSARFFSMYASKIEMEKLSLNEEFGLPPEMIRLQEEYIHQMENFKFLEAGRGIHSNFKSWFCDRWIEDHKNKIQSLDKETITEGIQLLNQWLTMMEPFCPFICYEIKKMFYKL